MMKELFTDLRDLCMLLVLVGLIVLGFCLLFPPPVHAGQRCVSVAAAAAQTTTLIAVPVAVPAGYPVYASPVGNVGMVAYGASQTGGAKASDSATREAKSVPGPVPPSPDGKPYGQYLAEFREFMSVTSETAIRTQSNQTQVQSAAPAALTSIQQHCVRCHNSTKKDAGLDLTGEISLEALGLSYDRVMGEVPHKSLMPPDKELTSEQLMPLIREIKDRIMVIARKSRDPS